MTFNIGFIGGGNMATAIVEGILKNKAHSPSNIWVSGPRLYNLKRWSELGTNCTTKNGEVFCKCDIIFLGVKPGMLHVAVSDCLNTLTDTTMSCKNVLFVSMLAGISIDELHRALEKLSQGIRIVRIMPNTPMMVQAGTCLLTPDPDVTDVQYDVLVKLLSGCGICEKVPESYMDTLGCLTACGPAFIYVVIEALADGAVKQGVPRDLALRLGAQTVSGSAQMVLQTGKHPGLLKDEVCSPGGSTICGITALENGKLRATMIAAIEAAVLRTKEHGKS